MKKDKQKTKVEFYMESGNGTENETPFAYFPDEISYGVCRSVYAHIGQHSSCSPEYIKDKRKATIKEYCRLLHELKGLGYNLEILNPVHIDIMSNQYGFPCKTYYYLVNENGETYHHKDKKWRYKTLIEMTTYYFRSMGEAQEMLNTLIHQL